MKKFGALVLAVAMIMSLASVSFAAKPVGDDFIPGEGISLVGPLKYSGDNDKVNSGSLKYGDTVYFLLVDSANNPIEKYAAVEKMKVKTSFELGEDLVASVSIVKKYISSDVDGSYGQVGTEAQGYLNNLDGYYYFIAVKTVAKETTSDGDVVGTFTIDRKAVDLDNDKDKTDDIELKIDDVELDFAFNVFYADRDWIADGEFDVEDSITIDVDEAYALKFSSDEEVEIEFGSDGTFNEGIFTVDASGQGKVYIKFNTNANDDIVAANPGVTMHFVNFNGVKFNRTGVYEYEMENGVAAYKVVDGKLVAIPGCEYDAADESFYFSTRVLENYVFASAELVNPVEEVEAPVVEPAVTNPSTGVVA